MKNLKLFLILLFISVCVYFIPNEYYEYKFYLFGSAGITLAAIYGYSRKMNTIIRALNNQIEKSNVRINKLINKTNYDTGNFCGQLRNLRERIRRLEENK